MQDNFTRGQLSEMFGAVACTWETSATLKTAQMNCLPSMGFRVITDNADKNMANDFQANLEDALHVLFTFLHHFLLDGWFIEMLNDLKGRWRLNTDSSCAKGNSRV